MKKIIIFLLALNLLSVPLWLQAQSRKEILPGAYQTEKYISLLLNKRVGIFTNHTAIVNKKHLIDTLLTRGVTIKKIFTPEHGLRGTADAGEATKDDNDPRTGIKIISLYGKKYGPDSTDLADLDVLVFDIQDVGTRFYTYISSLQYFMEAAKENSELKEMKEKLSSLQGYLSIEKIKLEEQNNTQRNIRSILYFFAGTENDMLLS